MANITIHCFLHLLPLTQCRIVTPIALSWNGDTAHSNGDATSSDSWLSINKKHYISCFDFFAIMGLVGIKSQIYNLLLCE